ncbi:MAG: hypothetical protein ABFE01_28170 [Phycisphaerales bacterium]
MKPRDLSKLGTWRSVTLHDDESAVSPAARTDHSKIRKPIRARVSTTRDLASTESLLARVKTLEESGRLHILEDSECLLGDGDDALLRTIRDEWFFMSIPREEVCAIIDGSTPSCPCVSMVARVGDGNDITLAIAFEVSNRSRVGLWQTHGSEIVSQRTERRTVTVRDGGTMAWVGLVPCDTKDERRSAPGRLPLVGGLFRDHEASEREEETVIVVTAQIVPDLPSRTIPGRQ